MSQTILDLEPKRFWHFFNEICKIPHETGNEAALRDYIVTITREWGCESEVDGRGNLVVRKPATDPNAKNTIVLQGHLDMVCEAEPGKNVDFSKDPIVPVVDGEWLTADGTTLGADNGVAMAAALAILESKDVKHGPIEMFLTVEEEGGLHGARALKGDFLKGRTLLNLDSEEDGVFFIGCAGGEESEVYLPITREKVPAGYTGLEIKVSGLKGGHSGLCIHEQRANAIKLVGRILTGACCQHDVILAHVDGGSKSNVIPPNATAKIAVKEGDVEAVKAIAAEYEKCFKEEYKKSDPGCQVAVTSTDISETFGKETSDKVICFIEAAIHGVEAMSLDIEGLVQTSTNLALAKVEGDRLHFEFASRSSSISEMAAIKGRVTSLAKLVGATAQEPEGYSGWQPNLNSEILKLTKVAYKELTGKDPHITAIHAGLECGVIGEKCLGMDMVSFGPDLEEVHSPNEKVRIQSVENFYNLLVKVLELHASS